jgi:hypothetical protein
MTIALILVLLACTALVVFVFRGRRKQLSVEDECNLSELLHAVDIEAFRNLVDEEEERFLRERLSPSAFRSVQRQRLRAAMSYIAGVSHNAEVLLHVGQAVRRSPDPQTAEAGRQLVDTASGLRIICLIAMARLLGRSVLPGVGFETTSIIGHYEQMRDSAALLSRLRDPANAGLVSRAL